MHVVSRANLNGSECVVCWGPTTHMRNGQGTSLGSMMRFECKTLEPRGSRRPYDSMSVRKGRESRHTCKLGLIV